jgi:hypothetical protein
VRRSEKSLDSGSVVSGAEEDDSVILSEDDENFTGQLANLKGAEYPVKVQDYIKSTLLPAPNHGVPLTNLAATKTGFSAVNQYKDFQFKQENLLEIMEKAKQEAVYRAKTKGKFSNNIAQDPRTNFMRDIGWLQKANPEAHKAEKEYMARDEFLMEKRRFQKIIQCVQLEEQYGMKGVTRIPEKYKDQFKK